MWITLFLVFNLLCFDRPLEPYERATLTQFAVKNPVDNMGINQGRMGITLGMMGITFKSYPHSSEDVDNLSTFWG